MQAYGDVYWVGIISRTAPRPDYYVRQLRDWKGSIEISTLDPKSLAMYAGHCAWTLARAHARSGDRVAIAAYLGGKDAFDQAIADFSAAYADKNERDFARLENAAAAGQIAVERGF
jgi:sugar/nucleoside kinase (ribokinase family)